MRAPVDWKATLNLPKTEFPMRADLARREPEWLARWARDKQYERILEAREEAGAAPFVLHDGPPYPTGGIHYGTVLNKVLKDIVVRSQLLMGKRAAVPARLGLPRAADRAAGRKGARTQGARRWTRPPSAAIARSTRSSSST